MTHFHNIFTCLNAGHSYEIERVTISLQKCVQSSGVIYRVKNGYFLIVLTWDAHTVSATDHAFFKNLTDRLLTFNFPNFQENFSIFAHTHFIVLLQRLEQNHVVHLETFGGGGNHEAVATQFNFLIFGHLERFFARGKLVQSNFTPD